MAISGALRRSWQSRGAQADRDQRFVFKVEKSMKTQFWLSRLLVHFRSTACLLPALFVVSIGLLSMAQPFAAVADEPDSAATQTTETDDPNAFRYSTREDHDPQGIGKFYMGREIAHVMSYHGAEWLERPEREKEERLSQLIKVLELKPGMVVADIGAGSGVISVLMADQIKPRGKVLAVDIQEEMLSLLRLKLKQLKVTNVETVLGTIKSPKLPPNSVDLAIFVDVYHELSFPFEMIQALSKSLKPGGRIVLVEYRKEDPSIPIYEVHKMTQAQAKKELQLPEFGLKWTKTIDKLPRQHVIVFEKQNPAVNKKSP